MHKRINTNFKARFIVFEQKKIISPFDSAGKRMRRNTTTDLSANDEPTTSVATSTQQTTITIAAAPSTATIPKSATCALPLSNLNQKTSEEMEQKKTELDNIRYLNTCPNDANSSLPSSTEAKADIKVINTRRTPDRFL